MKLLTKAIEILMDADVGEGGVKNQPKSADVVYGRPLYIKRELARKHRMGYELLRSFATKKLKCDN